jgi:hypothetical protein
LSENELAIIEVFELVENAEITEQDHVHVLPKDYSE